MFKKVYVEITNCCNLHCSFCIGTKREKKFMDVDSFITILSKLEGYTKYLYFHVLGEPLLHPKIQEFIEIAHSRNFGVNLTTNGYLIEKIKHTKGIRQVNISLHSYTEESNVSLEKYIETIFSCVSKLQQEGTIINYRMWTNSVYKDRLIHCLEKEYAVSLQGKKREKLAPSIFFEEEETFIWPSMENTFQKFEGSCRALRDHIAILVDGTVVPCCLDSAGSIVLGDIYKQDLDAIIKSDLFIQMKQGFSNNRKICSLCQKCNFYDLRIKKKR